MAHNKIMSNEPIYKVKLSDEVSEFLRLNSNMVMIDGLEYYQPAQFWYRVCYFGNDNIFEVHKELPTDEQDGTRQSNN